MHISDAGKNLMLAELASVATHIAIHEDGNPGPNGTGEAEHGDRESVTWGSPSGGEVSATNEPEFAVAGSTTIGGVSLWSALTAGTCYAGAGVTPEVFGGPGTYTLTQVTVDLNAAQ